MNSSDRQRMEHIRSYCVDVAKTVQRFGAEYETFLADTDYLNSVSMSIMQIGELSIGLSDEFKHTEGAEMPWGSIRGMRNLYAHAYAKMDKMSIWETATIDIPALERFCDKVLGRAMEKASVPQRLSDTKESVKRQDHTPAARDKTGPER